MKVADSPKALVAMSMMRKAEYMAAVKINAIEKQTTRLRD